MIDLMTRNRIYLDLHRQAPNERLPMISLAEKKLYYEEKPSDALRSLLVYKLHCEFNTWRCDAIIAPFPCWVVTVPAVKQIKFAGLSGVSFDEVLRTKYSL